MFDPNYDSANKIIEDGLLKWTVIVPVTKTCPPGQQGKTEPKATWGFARIRLVAICETGGGNACAGYAALRGWTGKNEKGPSAPKDLCKDYSNKAEIVIDRIQCISCDDADDKLGLKPVLVK